MKIAFSKLQSSGGTSSLVDRSLIWAAKERQSSEAPLEK